MRKTAKTFMDVVVILRHIEVLFRILTPQYHSSYDYV